MSDSLFEIEAESMDSAKPERDYPIAETQMAQIRTEFERLEIHSMADRQQLIESVTIRPIEKLQNLSAVEARRVLTRLRGWLNTPSSSGGSSWDMREEDTWIDKL